MDQELENAMLSELSDMAMQVWVECYQEMTQATLSLWEGEATSSV
jgi:hypothetical protein